MAIDVFLEDADTTLFSISQEFIELGIWKPLPITAWGGKMPSFLCGWDGVA
jgi:hypothetical protein